MALLQPARPNLVGKFERTVGRDFVFDQGDRTDATHATYSEGTFSSLNRLAGPSWQRVRELIEAWFERLCGDAKADVAARLRSGDDRQFQAAFLELYCHETLLRLGYRVACHPDVGQGGRRPDFLAEGEGGSLVLEATVAARSDQEVAAGRREAQVYDAINQVHSPDFFLYVEVKEAGQSPPSAARLRPRLEAWLKGLDYDAIRHAADTRMLFRSPEVPRFPWEDGGWRVEFLPIPKHEARGKPGLRPIGVHAPTVAFVDDCGRIRKAVLEKATAYGQLDVPYVVAVGVHELMPDAIDVTNALFGREQVAIRTYEDGRVETFPARARDGVWIGPRGVRHRRVSGVLTALGLRPWTVATAVPTLWHHPAATHELVVRNAPWREAMVDRASRRLTFREPAIRVVDFFGLEEGWPGPEPGF
jgi:hypothetical protein